jgi:hypothetical protein
MSSSARPKLAQTHDVAPQPGTEVSAAILSRKDSRLDNQMLIRGIPFKAVGFSLE